MSNAVVTTISTVLSRTADIVNDVAKVASQAVPRPDAQLQDKYRWLQCTLKNETPFDMVLLDSYFDSGRYWTAPGNVNKWDQMVWSACNRDESVFTGVAGGNAFRILMDSTNSYDVAFGFTNPTVGAYKAGVALNTSKGVDGYERADSEGKSLLTKAIFEAKDSDGNPVRFRFQVSAAAGQQPVFVVKQVFV